MICTDYMGVIKLCHFFQKWRFFTAFSQWWGKNPWHFGWKLGTS